MRNRSSHSAPEFNSGLGESGTLNCILVNIEHATARSLDYE
jgi:hypothetical protein